MFKVITTFGGGAMTGRGQRGSYGIGNVLFRDPSTDF